MSGSGKRYRGGRRYTLVFGDDTDFAGLEVVMRSMSFGGLLELAELADTIGDVGADGAKVDGRALNVLRDFCSQLAPQIAWWNVDDDDGQPVPVTADGLLSQDAGMVMAVFTGFFEHVTKAPPPLPKPSPPVRSQETAIPMTPLSRVS